MTNSLDTSSFRLKDTKKLYPIGSSESLFDENKTEVNDKDLTYVVDTYTNSDHLKLQNFLINLGINIRHHFTAAFLLTDEEMSYLKLAIKDCNNDDYTSYITIRLFEIKWV